MKDLCDHLASDPEERLEELQELDENFDVDEDEQLEEEYDVYGIRPDPDPFAEWGVDDDSPGGTDEAVAEE